MGAITATLMESEVSGHLKFDGDHVGMVFFSSRDGFNGAEFNRSGILDDPSNSNPAAWTFSEANALLHSFDTTYRLGGASDVLL